jgi:DtxR family transcriptional regulator, Mn-dependent transcriptional regulator
MSHSEATQEYLKAICKLGGGHEPVALSALASRLDVSPVSTHEMVRRLTDQDLVAYQPYKGVMLTPAGIEAANRVLRGHRLWERFLHDMLGLPWAQVHEEANRLEHVTSPAVAQKLAEFLNNPDFCPHGHPIEMPGCDCENQGEAWRLSDLEPGERCAILNVPEDDPDMLTYLDEMGLHPGVRLSVLEVAPFDGPTTVTLRGERKVIGHKLATQIMVYQRETDSPEYVAA